MQHCIGKIHFNVAVIFLGQHYTGKNVAHEAAKNIAQEKILCSVVLILLGQNSTGKTLCNVVLEAADNNAQGKSFSMLS